MGKLNIYTPDGVQDTLFYECEYKRDFENTVIDTFTGCGFFEIETPTYEFYDVFDSLDGICQENCFKFFDREGRILTLRPDLTTPISRVVSTKFSEKDFPLKISYIGNAFRYEDVQKGGRQREFTQAGIEIYGDDSPEADAEVIVTAIKTLKAVGLSEFKFDIGNVLFFEGLIEKAGLNKEMEDKILEYLNSKETFMLSEYLDSIDIDEKIKNILLELPEAFGDIEVLEKYLDSDINETSKKALLNLKEVYEIIKDYGYEKYVSIDLGLIQSIKYYTGIVFKGFTYGVGFPICGGGRYDKLSERFGKSISATGCALSVSRLVSCMLLKEEEIDKVACDIAIFFDKEERKQAIALSESLRHDGLSVEIKVKTDMENDLSYLRRKGIANGIFLKGEKAVIHNIKENTITETSCGGLL